MKSTQPQFGYFLLADISGFSSYLAGVELEHAGGILQKMLEGIARKIASVLRVQDFDIDFATVHFTAKGAKKTFKTWRS